MKKQTFAVLGLGLFGSSLARTLAQEGHDVIAIDRDMSHVEEVANLIDQSIQADFTKYDQLLEAGVNDVEVAIVATSSRLEDTIVGILNLQKLGVPYIVVKSKNKEYRDVLLKVGAHRVVLPEVEMGRRIGRELSNPSVHELMDIDHRNNISIFTVMDAWVGKKIADINFRTDYGINIIAVKHQDEDDFDVDFSADYIIQSNDEFIGISKEDMLKRIFNN